MIALMAYISVSVSLSYTFFNLNHKNSNFSQLYWFRLIGIWKTSRILINSYKICYVYAVLIIISYLLWEVKGRIEVWNNQLH